MENMLQQLKADFEHKTFHFNDTGDPRMKKTYYCEKVEFMGGNFKIICVNRTFAKKDFEISAFKKQCQFVSTQVSTVENESHSVEVLPAYSKIDTVSDSIFSMFEKVSSNGASKEDFEKAKLMIGLSNQIINAEKIKLGYQTLKSK